MYYIAYGSNINLEQMARRCPHSKRIGTGKVRDWKLVFKYHADIVPCEGNVLPVLVWDIDKRDWPSLDRYEGYPAYYIRKTIPVTLDSTGETFDAVVYVMTAIHGGALEHPSMDYFNIIKRGCEANGIDVEYLYEALDDVNKAAPSVPFYDDEEDIFEGFMDEKWLEDDIFAKEQAGI